MTFQQALTAWQAAQIKCCEAKLAYELAYATALCKADGKSSEVRKAQADLEAVVTLRAAELAAIDAKAAEHMVLYLRGDTSQHEGA